MRLVLDTHGLTWTAEHDDTHHLGARARDAIDDGSNARVVSVASAWEIATKRRRGRDPFDRIAAQSIIEGAQLVTADPAMRVFGADILW